VLAVVVVAATVVFSLAGGAGNGSGATDCPPTVGRLFCTTTTVTPSPVSASVDGVTAYVKLDFVVANQGGSTLTNGVATIDLADRVEGILRGSSSADFVAALTPGCTDVGGPKQTVVCSLPNLTAAGGAGATTAVSLVYRTSITPKVDSTDATVTVAMKEKRNDGQQTDPNPDTHAVTEPIGYEPCTDCSYAWSPTNQGVTLSTAPDANTWGSFSFTNRGGGFIARMTESAAASSAAYCVPGRNCFGQVIRTVAADAVLGSEGLLAWTTIWSLKVVPGTVDDTNVVIVHQLDPVAPGADPEVEVISRRCPDNLPPTAADVEANGPCLLASIQRGKAQTLTVRWWARHNGFGRGG
jgi:hypothetical protein